MASKQSKRGKARGKKKQNKNKKRSYDKSPVQAIPELQFVMKELESLWDTEEGQDNEGNHYNSLKELWYSLFPNNTTKENVVEVVQHKVTFQQNVNRRTLSPSEFFNSLRSLNSSTLWPPSALQNTEKTKIRTHLDLETLEDNEANALLLLLDLHLNLTQLEISSTSTSTSTSVINSSHSPTNTTNDTSLVSDHYKNSEPHTNTETASKLFSSTNHTVSSSDYRTTSSSNVMSSQSSNILNFLDNNSKEWYMISDRYWQRQEATTNGMLGGYGHISDIDIRASYLFLLPFIEGQKGQKISTNRAVDMGAGIGRVTKNLLSKLFNKIDLVEPNATFLERARQELHDIASVDHFINVPLQNWTPDPNTRYDLIWVQWVLLYLTDSDLITFLRRCKQALTPGGIIVVKENCTLQGGFVFDKNDASITRSLQHLKLIFQASGLTLLKEEQQRNFPRQLLPVKMFALS